MLSGPELLAEAALFASATVRAGHVSDSSSVGRLLDAGAQFVSTRQIAPADAAARVATLVDESTTAHPEARASDVPQAVSAG